MNLLNGFFYPSSVVIVGISRKKPSLGQLVLSNIESSGYEGDIYLVHPKAEKINDYNCYKSISEIQQEIDLVIVIAPARFVEGIIDEAINKNAKACTIITAGFSEVSEEGKEIELRIKERIDGTGLRIIGPNSMGTFSETIHASFSPIKIGKGNVAYLSQSGSILVVILEHFLPYNIGFSKCISLGNKLDINTNMAIKYLQQDTNTKIINAYLESFSSPRKFREEVSPIAREKPIVIVKSGRTTAGAKAASSHTGALAGENKLVNAVLQSSGIIQVNTLEDQVKVNRILLKYPDIQPGGIAIISSAGGPATLATDEVIENGLELAEFTDLTNAKLDKIVPSEGSYANPIDVLAAADETTYDKALQILLADTNIAAILVIIVHPVLIETNELLKVIEKLDRPDKPIICAYLGPDFINYQEATELLITGSTLEALKMIKSVMKYNTWKQNYQELHNFSHLENLEQRNSIKDPQSLLEGYGFEFPSTDNFDSVDDALLFASEIGYPVVLKLKHKQFSHKSDVGGVILDIRNEREFTAAWDKLWTIYVEAEIPPEHAIIEVQKFHKNGLEIALGIVYDQMFGHFIMVGIGGTQVELYEEVAFHPSPISAKTAENMIMQTRLQQILDGYRGTKPVDPSIIVDKMLTLDRLIQEHPYITELDINPLLILPDHSTVIVDARASFS